MEKRRFFDHPAGLTVAKIILLTGSECRDAALLSCLIADVAPLDLAGPNDLAFIESHNYADALATTRAGACLMPQRFESRAPKTLIVLSTEEPYRAFVNVHSELYPQSLRPTSLFDNDISKGSTIHPTARQVDIADFCCRRRANSCSSTGYFASMRMSALPEIYADTWSELILAITTACGFNCSTLI